MGSGRVTNTPASISRASSQPLTPLPLAASSNARLTSPGTARGTGGHPLYRKFLAHTVGNDPGGFGPNLSTVDDFDIPTVLRKQMDLPSALPCVRRE